MRPAVAALVLSLAATATDPARAQAWVMAPGAGQAILKVEAMRADDGFDPAGERAALPARRADDVASLYLEYGLFDGVAVLVKGDWQSGRDAFVSFEGRGPVELGLRWQVWRDDSAAVSLQASIAEGGEGRNAGYAAPGAGERDYEVRLAAGRAFPLLGRRAFAEVQAARRMRDGLADETRVDATLGLHLDGGWMLLGQAFGGMADDDGPRWLNVETSVVRAWGDWSVQMGWRSAVAGRETPVASGPVIGLWRRF
jgi:protein XagA